MIYVLLIQTHSDCDHDKHVMVTVTVSLCYILNLFVTCSNKKINDLIFDYYFVIIISIIGIKPKS